MDIGSMDIYEFLKEKQPETVRIGNTTFYVTANFSGSVQLQYLIKRLIKKEIEQENIAH